MILVGIEANHFTWRGREAMQLQSFEFSVSDVMVANGQSISNLIFFAYFC